MFSLLVVIALVTASNADPVSRKTNPMFPNGRIVGGENAVIETYPYQISLQFYGRHNCGGSILSANWVITAGHCVDLSAKHLTVRAGTSIENEGGSVHQVVEVIRHEDYYINDDDVPLNDIALIRVRVAFEFDETRQPINLYEINEEAKAGVSSVITGWGETKKLKYDGQLQTVSVPIISKKLCNIAYGEQGGIPEGQICAAYYGVGGKDSCQGDSGGPLVIAGRLAGIVSWGNGCADSEYPGVYTEIAHYREWVNRHVEL